MEPVSPAPNGPIYLVMCLHWPKVEPLFILLPGEGTWQPGENGEAVIWAGGPDNCPSA